MRENFDSLMDIMKLLFVLVEEIDPELYKYLAAAKAEPYFSISWVLTWFAHDVSALEDIARVYDAILCSHPSYIIYLCSSVSFRIVDAYCMLCYLKYRLSWSGFV